MNTNLGDWQHPNIRAAPPDDGLLVNLQTQIAPEPEGSKYGVADYVELKYMRLAALEDAQVSKKTT